MDRVYDLLDIAAKNHPIKALASDIGKGESTLRHELNRQPGYKLGLDTAFQILKHTGDIKALERMAQKLDHLLVPIPKNCSLTDKTWLQHISKISKEAGDAVSFLAEAVSDGKITDKEREKLDKEICEAMQALAAVHVTLKGGCR